MAAPLDPQPLDPLGGIREAAAGWSGAPVLDDALSAVGPLLGRSFFLDQPNIIGMGVVPWDAVALATGATPPNPIARARRMVGRGPLDDLLAEEDEPDQRPDDPGALARGADLVDAVQRLDAARQALPDGAPDRVYDALTALRADVAERLQRERRQSPALNAALARGDLSDPALAEHLRAPADEAAPAPPARRARGPIDWPSEAQPVAQDWPQAIEAPPPLTTAAPPAEARPSPDVALAQLAQVVAQQTGRPVSELLAEALNPSPPQPPESASGDANADGKAPPRRAQGAAATTPTAPPIRVGRIAIDGLNADTDPEIRRALEAALKVLPAAVARRAQPGTAHHSGDKGRVDVALMLRPGDPPAAIADRIAHAIVRSGALHIDTLQLGVSARPSTRFDDASSLLARLTAGDAEGLAHRMLGERRQLDGPLRDRLARFFGSDFSDVMVFAGPMAGTLARSLSAEAVTHGKMVFFDPKHFRTDTAQGEALVAHELAHTQQDDSQDSRWKEAQALAIEAAYLDWIQPGGAALAEDNPLDPTAPSAAGAGDNPAGVMTAKTDRHLEAKQGPRAETGEHEERIKQVLDRVRTLLADAHDDEGALLGRLTALLRTKL